MACAALAGVLVLLALTVLRPPATNGGSTRDFQAYLAAGRAANAGADPYGAGIATYEPALDASRGAMLPFVGTPASVRWWQLLAHRSDRDATTVWTAVLVASLLALVWGTARVSNAATPFERTCIALAALAFAPIDGAIALGQTAIVAAAAAVLAATANAVPAVSAWSFVALVFQPNLGVALLAIIRRKGAWIALAVAAAALVLTCGGAALGYAAILHAHAAAEAGALMQLTPRALGAPFALAVLAGMLALGAVGYVAIRGTPYASFAAACAALPFVVGFFHPHDLAIVFVPAVWCLRRAPAPLFGVALLAATGAATNWLDVAQSPHALAQDGALAAAFIAAACALRPRVHRASLPWIAAAVALVASGLWVAAHDPLPVWPDDLAAFAPHAAIGAAAQWHEELARSGLLTPNAGSVVLRALALGGCAVLLWIVARTLDVDVHHRVER